MLNVIGFNQYSWGWCAYCSTASIINYVRNAMLDPSIVCYGINGDYRDEGAYKWQVRSYASSIWSFNNLYETSSLMGMSTIKNEIDNNRPIYHEWTSTRGVHATVLNGYTDSEQYGKYYYFVNSWGDTPSFSVSLGSSEYYIWVNAGIFYSFNGAIYNWK